jgi:hypothetical protein
VTGKPTQPDLAFQHLEEVFQQIRSKSPKIISIDGCCGVGKSILATKIANSCSAKVLELDKFLIKKTGHYVKSMKWCDLRAAVKNAMITSNIVVIEGICIKSILSKLGLLPDLTIYVQMLSKAGVVQNLNVLDCEDGLPNENPKDVLDWEIAEYHAKYRPKSNADLVCMSLEADEPPPNCTGNLAQQ